MKHNVLTMMFQVATLNVIDLKTSSLCFSLLQCRRRSTTVCAAWNQIQSCWIFLYWVNSEQWTHVWLVTNLLLSIENASPFVITQNDEYDFATNCCISWTALSTNTKISRIWRSTQGNSRNINSQLNSVIFHMKCVLLQHRTMMIPGGYLWWNDGEERNFSLLDNRLEIKSLRPLKSDYSWTLT